MGSMQRGLTWIGILSWLTLALIFPVQMAQAQQQDDDLVKSSVRDLTTVLVVGAGGAVLGLSTLSFTKTPKNHLRNILIGGAVGIIVGVGVVAYNQANTSRSEFEQQAAYLGEPKEFNTLARVQWHDEHYERRFETAPVPHVLYQFSF